MHSRNIKPAAFGPKRVWWACPRGQTTHNANMDLKIIATTFPAIALAFGGVMLMAGNSSGWPLVILGGLAQGAYLLARFA